MSQEMSAVDYEDLRKNWGTYEAQIIPDPELFDRLLFDFEQKQQIDITYKYYSIIRQYIAYEEMPTEFPPNSQDQGVTYVHTIDNVLILRGLHGGERAALHKLCDSFGLHHESFNYTERERELRIFKPADGWRWEFSSSNPSSLPAEVYEQRRAERDNKRAEDLRRRYCAVCKITADQSDLYSSEQFRGLYCGPCLETQPDRRGGVLADHYFQRKYYMR
jgi:hypothetical protein